MPRACHRGRRWFSAAAASGVTVTDLDGNVFYDLAGSYGMNLFGVDFYREPLSKILLAKLRSLRGNHEAATLAKDG